MFMPLLIRRRLLGRWFEERTARSRRGDELGEDALGCKVTSGSLGEGRWCCLLAVHGAKGELGRGDFAGGFCWRNPPC